MAKPNYAFEKRQRERAKKEKKAEKLAQRKAGGGEAGPAIEPDAAAPDQSGERPVEASDAPQPVRGEAATGDAAAQPAR